MNFSATYKIGLFALVLSLLQLAPTRVCAEQFYGDKVLIFNSLDGQENQELQRNDAYRLAGLAFIDEEFSFGYVFQEAVLFWQSDTKRQQRWLKRADPYFDEEKVKELARSQGIQSHISLFCLNRSKQNVVVKLVDEFTTELFILGFIWWLLGIGVILTKGELFIIDTIFTVLIAIWFGVKTYQINEKMESYIKSEQYTSKSVLTHTEAYSNPQSKVL